MKKLFCILMVMALLVTTAAADVIWEPEDRFFEQHRSECVREDRSYYAAGDAAVAVYNKPGGRAVGEIPAGSAVNISHIWTSSNGDAWGLVDARDQSFWVPMTDAMQLVYDVRSFTKQFSSQFRDYDGSFEELCTSEDIPVVFYSFPGSGFVVARFDHLEQSYSALSPDKVWTDSEGRVWGQIGYYMAARGWVCLSDPSNEEIPAAEYAMNVPRAQSGDILTASGRDNTVAAVGAGVGGVAAVSLVLLAVFRYLKKKR